MQVEARLKELGIELPNAPSPVANYVPAVQVGNLLFLSGHGALDEQGKPLYTGKVPSQASPEQGYQAARATALACIATMKRVLGDLDRVKRIVKLLVMVNADADFTGHSQVANGASDLMVEVFGDRGKHARSAVGMSGLPLGLTVEIEVIAEVE